MSQNVVPSSVPSKTKNTDSENVSKNKSARLRLRNELMTVMKSQNDKKVTVSAFPDDGDIFKWIATIVGPADTVYEGLTYKLSLEFTTNYPFSAPVVKFITHCFHPNVDQSGNICLDILKEKWSASYDVLAILLSIQSLLGEPNNASPLNAEAAALWSNQKLYKKQLTEQYALKNKETKK